MTPKPKLEMDCAQMLVLWALPGPNEDQLQEYLSHRGAKKARHRVSVLTSDNVEAAGGDWYDMF